MATTDFLSIKSQSQEPRIPDLEKDLLVKVQLLTKTDKALLEIFVNRCIASYHLAELQQQCEKTNKILAELDIELESHNGRGEKLKEIIHDIAK